MNEPQLFKKGDFMMYSMNGSQLQKFKNLILHLVALGLSCSQLSAQDVTTPRDERMRTYRSMASQLEQVTPQSEKETQAVEGLKKLYKGMGVTTAQNLIREEKIKSCGQLLGRSPSAERGVYIFSNSERETKPVFCVCL